MIFFGIIFYISSFTCTNASDFYDIPDAGRPRSAFGLCCCKKENENKQTTFYSCRYVDEDGCPEGSKPYSVEFGTCPTHLMFSKPQHEN